MTILDNINNGKYKNDLPYGQVGRALWRQREKELVEQFWADVNEEYHLDPEKYTKHRRMLQIAWDEGHSAGLSSVLYWIDVLYELVN